MHYQPDATATTTLTGINPPAPVAATVSAADTPAPDDVSAAGTVVVLCWVESERGWGPRLDGASVHSDQAAAERFVAAYWAKMPASAPAEYSRPEGPPRVLAATAAVLARLTQSGDGLWTKGTNWPGAGSLLTTEALPDPPAAASAR